MTFAEIEDLRIAVDETVILLLRPEGDAGQITLFDSVGFAIEDFAALRYIHRKAIETGLFTNLDMIADPDDPRDLYGMVMRAA